MSADLVILPTLGASGYAKTTSVGTSTDAGDAFGQMLRGLQNGLPGDGATAAVTAAADGGPGSSKIATSDATARIVGQDGVQVTNAVAIGALGEAVTLPAPMATAAGAATGLPVVGIAAKGIADQVLPVERAGAGGQAAAATVDAGVAKGVEAVAVPEASGSAATVPVAADHPASPTSGDAAAGRPAAGARVHDAQGSVLKPGKVMPTRDGVGHGKAAVPLAAAVPVGVGPDAAVIEAMAAAQHPPLLPNGSAEGAVAGSNPAGGAAGPTVGLASLGSLLGGTVVGDDFGQGAVVHGGLDAAATGAVRDTAASGAGAAPGALAGRGGAGVSPGAGALAAEASLGLAGSVPHGLTPGAAGGASQASVPVYSGQSGGGFMSAPPVAMPAGPGLPGGGASVGALPAGPEGAPAAGRGWMQAGSSGGGTRAGEAVDGIAPAVSGSAGPTQVAAVDRGGPFRGVSAGRPGSGMSVGGAMLSGAVRVEDTTVRVTGMVQDASAISLGQRGLDVETDPRAHATDTAPVKPEQASMVGAGNLAATSVDPVGPTGSDAALAAAARVEIAVPGGAVADAATPISNAGPEQTAPLETTGRRFSEFGRGGTVPGMGAGHDGVATSAAAAMGAGVPNRAVFPPITQPVPSAATSARVQAPVAAGARAVSGSAVHSIAADEGSPASAAGVPAQNPPMAEPVVTPVAVENFGEASGLVAQASAAQGVAGSRNGFGATVTSDASALTPAPQGVMGDRHVSWLPAIEGVVTGGQAFAQPAAVGATAGTAAGRGASARVTATAPMQAGVQVDRLLSPMPEDVRAGKPVAADAPTGEAAAPAADHKTMPHAADLQPDPVPAAAAVALPDPSLAVTMPSAPAAEAPVVPVAQAAPARLPEPAEQVGPALLTLAKTTDGAQEMTVRMQPTDLGMVQVRITRSGSGTTQVDITAEKTSTLLALQRDQPQLHRTLDEAGISAIGRTITIHAAPVVQAASADSTLGLGGGHSGGQQGGGQHGQGGRTSAGSADGDGGGGSDRGGFSGRETNGYAGGRRSGVASERVAANVNTASRAGLDITA